MRQETHFWKYNDKSDAYELVNYRTGQIVGRVWEKLGYWVLASSVREKHGEFATMHSAMDALLFDYDYVLPYVEPAPAPSGFQYWVNRILDH